ncbi:MAG: hypothetical protein WC091_12025 [Sulfuricellaceae bacterium]
MNYKAIFEELRAIHDARMGSRVQIVMNINVMTQLSSFGPQPAQMLSGDTMEIWRTGDKALPSG